MGHSFNRAAKMNETVSQPLQSQALPGPALALMLPKLPEPLQKPFCFWPHLGSEIAITGTTRAHTRELFRGTVIDGNLSRGE